MGIDWTMGTAPVTFSAYLGANSTTSQTADHPLVIVTVQFTIAGPRGSA